MRVKVQVEDEEQFRELKYRLYDIWEEEPVARSDKDLAVIIQDPPTALLGELRESGFALTFPDQEAARQV